MGTSITSIAEHAFEALRAAGYMESTVGQYRKIFRYLSESSEDGMWSDGVGEAFVAATRPDGRPFEHNYVNVKQFFLGRVSTFSLLSVSAFSRS